MEKRLKIRILALLSAVLLTAALFAVPASAATFPDTMLNILDCYTFIGRIRTNLKNPNVSVVFSATNLGRIAFAWNGTGDNYINTNYLGTMRELCPTIKAGVSYCFHGEEGHDVQDFPIRAQIVIDDPTTSEWDKSIPVNTVFVLTEEELDIPIFFACYNLTPAAASHLVDHMFITPSPFPITYKFTNEEYPVFFDYDQAIAEAQQELLEQLEKNTVSIFRSATLRVDLMLPGVDFTPDDLDDYGAFSLSDVSFSVTEDGTVSLAPIFNYAVERARSSFPNYDYTFAYFDLDFSWPLQADYAGTWPYKPLKVSSVASVNPSILDTSVPAFFGYDSSGAVHSPLSIRVIDSTSFYIDAARFSDSESTTISRFNLRFGDGSVNVRQAVVGWRLSSEARVTSPLYAFGYATGFLDGQNSEFGDLADEYYNDGFVSGFDKGRLEGLTISQTGDWKQLVGSVVEAPVNYFQSLFNFEILGLDMRVAFGSILALCVLLIIVKKVLV